MKSTKAILIFALGTVIAGFAYAALGQHTHSARSADTGQKESASHDGHTAPPDGRVLVRFPDQLRVHTMANMRDHLLALAQIQDALGKDGFDEAAKIAEERLGMSSLTTHGAHEVSKFMPKGMQDAGTAMHRGASRFAVELQNTAVTGDLKPALAALAQMTQACVACHAGYRLN